jgi:eukaryotic-like serine/threonine-protein kinase
MSYDSSFDRESGHPDENLVTMEPEERLRHPEDWVGIKLHGKWRLDELLGVGGVASVYAATTRHGRRVALKLMHAHWADEPTVCKRFLREGYAANRVKHPAVVTAFADGVTESGLPFLVLELMEGRNLDMELMVNGLMPVGQVLEIADQVLDALVASHAKGVVHRDLKPDNLLLLHGGDIRVLDFGIARMRDHAPQDPRLTVNGRAMGTPGFMSPEQARGDWDDVDVRTDIWSMGATMFALLTGREPHEGELQQELLVAAMTQPVTPLQDVDPSVPDRVAELIDRALAFRPEERWGTAAEMQRAVRQARALVEPGGRDEAPPTLRPVTTNPQASPPQPTGGRRWRYALVAAAFAAAITALGVRFESEVSRGADRVMAAVSPPPVAASRISGRVAELAAGIDIPAPPEPTDAEPTDAEPTDAEPTDAEPTDAEPTDAEPTDAEPTDAEPTDATPDPSEEVVSETAASDSDEAGSDEAGSDARASNAEGQEGSEDAGTSMAFEVDVPRVDESSGDVIDLDEPDPQ